MSRLFRHPPALALVVLIGLNFILAVTVVALVLHKSERLPTPSAREVSPDRTTKETPGFTSQPKLPPYTDLATASDRRRWIVDQLRAAGVPNNVLARVVRSDLDEVWDKRFEELAEKVNGDPDSLAALQLDRDRDEETEMRAALGKEGYRQWDQANMLREVNIGKIPLTDSEANAIYDLKKKLQQRRRELEQARLKGEMNNADINRVSDQAYSELNQQMKALLGDERYAKSQGLERGKP